MRFGFLKSRSLFRFQHPRLSSVPQGPSGRPSPPLLSPTWRPSSHSSLTLPPPPLGSAARRDAAEDALSPFGSNAHWRLAPSSRAPPRLNSVQGARRLPARLPHASPQLGAGAAAAGVGGGWGALGEDRTQLGYGRLQWFWDRLHSLPPCGQPRPSQGGPLARGLPLTLGAESTLGEQQRLLFTSLARKGLSGDGHPAAWRGIGPRFGLPPAAGATLSPSPVAHRHLLLSDQGHPCRLQTTRGLCTLL